MKLRELVDLRFSIGATVPITIVESLSNQAKYGFKDKAIWDNANGALYVSQAVYDSLHDDDTRVIAIDVLDVVVMSFFKPTDALPMTMQYESPGVIGYNHNPNPPKDDGSTGFVTPPT